MRKLIVTALLVAGLSAVLGSTVFREGIAQAVTALLVREQNVDASGYISVHEQGTAAVRVTNPSLPVAAMQSGPWTVNLFGPAAVTNPIDRVTGGPMPLIVREVRVPWHIQAGADFQDGSFVVDANFDAYVVPPGMIAVIEYISAEVFDTAPGSVIGSFELRNSGLFLRFPATEYGDPTGRAAYQVSQAAKVYAAGGSGFEVSAARMASSGGGKLIATLSGYLTPQ